jgi:hypothetical protein
MYPKRSMRIRFRRFKGCRYGEARTNPTDKGETTWTKRGGAYNSLLIRDNLRNMILYHPSAHLTPGLPKDKIVEASWNMIGVQSTHMLVCVLHTPEFCLLSHGQLYARVKLSSLNRILNTNPYVWPCVYADIKYKNWFKGFFFSRYVGRLFFFWTNASPLFIVRKKSRGFHRRAGGSSLCRPGFTQ